MAIKQDYVDRTKAVGFYKHIEWHQAKGVMITILNEKVNGKIKTTFEKAKIDVEYDQKLPHGRVFYASRRDAVGFMLNLGMQTIEIARTFQLIDGGSIVSTIK